MSKTETIGDATLYFGDCWDILPALPKVDAVVTDPPYGTAELMHQGSKKKWKMAIEQKKWDIYDDQVLTLLEYASHCIIWGGQFFPLPPKRGWLVWNKIIRNFQSSVCELAWTTLEKPVDAFDYSHGQLALEGKEHPTQKPEPLMRWCIEKLPPSCSTILDPFMGSGSTGVAAIKLGRKFIGIEKQPKYFDIACRRIEEAAKQPYMLIQRVPEPKQESWTEMWERPFMTTGSEKCRVCGVGLTEADTIPCKDQPDCPVGEAL